MKNLKKMTRIFTVMILFAIIFFSSCDKQEDQITLQKNEKIEQETLVVSQDNISDEQTDDINLYIKSMEEEGYSDAEIEKMLVEYLNTQQNSKAVNYTYTVAGVKIGCWMLKSGSTTNRADWMGKLPYEPITNMWRDKVAVTSTQALLQVKAHLGAKGFNQSLMHSYNYYGYINGTYKYNATGNTYSDDIFTHDNNHGRIFGPVKVGEYWITLGAFSRETGTEHKFVNFYQARDKAAGTSTYFPTSASNVASGNTWADGYSTIKMLTRI
jgi:hypothetical protein